MSKMAVCGHFGGNRFFADGQTVKTRSFHEVLANHVGNDRIEILDTYKWKKNIPFLIIKLLWICFLCDVIIIMPDFNGIKVMARVFNKLKSFFRFKLHYVVIGGWLPDYLKEDGALKKNCGQFNGIFVETKVMKKQMNEMGLDNVFIMPNFKNIRVSTDISSQGNAGTYSFCTFSRILFEKGIEDAIKVVENINAKYGRSICSLDIYGQIDKDYFDRFSEILANAEKYIRYKGVINYNDSVKYLSNYYLLFFPTFYESEGLPGTIIDAMASGIPVVASDWHYNNELIIDGYNGYLFQTRNIEDFQKKVEYLIENEELVNEMKLNCIKEANKYSPDYIINEFLENIEWNDPYKIPVKT